MKRFTGLSVALLLALLVSACDISVSLGGGIVSITNASFESRYAHDGRSVVCDDRSTRLDIELSFVGAPTRAVFFLEGSGGGYVELRTLELSGGQVEGGNIKTTVSIGRQVAPLSSASVGSTVSEEISPSAIIVVPRPEIIGHTRLGISLRGLDSVDTVHSGLIPVLRACS